MADVLKDLPVDKVWGWYLRLGMMFAKKTVEGDYSLSGAFLLAYLNNKVKDTEIKFDAPKHLKMAAPVVEGLKYHRAVYLTEKKARIGDREIWAGLKPRLEDGRWNGKDPIDLHYESLVEFGSGLLDVIRIQRSGSDAERDLFASLRGFQLRTDITATGHKTSSRVTVKFTKWQAMAKDRYDFNYNEHLTVPNPDYGSDAESAVAPGERTIRVYHSNAKRMEDAGLAQPFQVRVGPWKVDREDVVGDGVITL